MKEIQIKKGMEMINRLGDNYLYVREIEDEANEEGYSLGIKHGIVVGIIVELVILSLIFL